MRASRAVTVIVLASVSILTLSACSSGGGSELPTELTPVTPSVAPTTPATTEPVPSTEPTIAISSDSPTAATTSAVRGWLTSDTQAICPDGSEPLVTKERTTPQNVTGTVAEFVVCPPFTPDMVNARGTVLDPSMPLFVPLETALSAESEPVDPAVSCPTVNVYHLIYAVNDAGEVWEVDVPRDQCGFPQQAVTDVVVYALPPTR